MSSAQEFSSFFKGTLIYTSQGLIPIEDVTANNRVWTHKHCFQQVLAQSEHQITGLCRLKAAGSPETYVTKQHRYLTGRKGETKVQWKMVRDLTPGDFLAMPVNQDDQNPLALSPEEVWLLGRYTGNGTIISDKSQIKGSRLFFHVLHPQFENFRQNVDLTAWHIYKDAECHHLSTDNQRLKQLAFACGKGSKKVIPAFIFNLSPALLKTFLKGFFSNQQDQQSFISENISLLYQLGLIYAKAYNKAYDLIQVNQPSFLQKAFYQINSSLELILNSDSGFLEDGYLWQSVQAIDELRSFQGTVYHLKVDIDHSYTANNCLVHDG